MPGSFTTWSLNGFFFRCTWVKVFKDVEARCVIHEGSGAKSSSSNPKKVSPHDEARDANCSADEHAEGNGDNVRAASSKRLHLTGAMDEVEDEDKSANFGNAFDNIPIPSDIPTDLNRVGDIDFEMGASLNINDAMIEEAIEALNVLTDRTTPRIGKDIHIKRNLVERGNSASPVQTHHSVDGPSTFEINAKTLGIPLDDKGIPRAPSHGDAVPAPSIFTIRVTLASQGIFSSAIKIFGIEYLTLLKQTPFDKVSVRHREASQVYKAIQVMHDDPEPLKCKVDEYVWAIKDHLALKASVSDRRSSDQVEEERLTVAEELKLAESSCDAILTKHKGLEEENAALKKKEDELLKENSSTTLEATVHAMKRRLDELEAFPVCNTEEMELFEEQERKLLEFQSSLDSSEWIM
ncbi:putative methylthioribose-1-phosphate isomerase [Bienertia sinuspersici]